LVGHVEHTGRGMSKKCEFNTVMGRGNFGALDVEGVRIKFSCTYEKDVKT
jgi:hypothetical protein